MLKSSRKNNGTSMAELPLVLLILFVILGFPLIDLVTITLQCTWVRTVVRRAAEESAKKATFDDATDPNSARATAKRIIENSLAPMNIKTETPDVKIVVLKGAKTTNSPATRKDHSATIGTYLADQQYHCFNPDVHVSELEVSVKASITPFLVFNKSMFGKVPGLTEPFEIRESARAFFEHPESLFEHESQAE